MPRVLYTVVIRYVDGYTVSTSDVIEAGGWKLNHSFLLDVSASKTPREIVDILEVCHHLSHYLPSFTNTASQPFTEVTPQMSQSKIPTIPFILPLYHKMEQHLITVSASWDMSFKIQRAAKHGLEKLRKYTIPAKLHHSYIIRTSKCTIDPNVNHNKCTCFSSTPMSV